MTYEGKSPVATWSDLVGDLDDENQMLVIVSAERTIDALVSENMECNPDVSVRIIRGVRTQTVSTLLQEWAAALQFPYYFGHNWDAFEECINDLEWVPAAKHLVFVTRAENVLRDDDRGFAIFVEILVQATKKWSVRSGWWRVVLQSDSANVALLQNRLARVGVGAKRVTL